MNESGRDESDTPRMETRTFRDDRGRRWAGSVMSGRFEGGEERAEVFFVCEDVPSEPKRAVQLDQAPREAAEHWRGLGEEEVRNLFRDSEPA